VERGTDHGVLRSGDTVYLKTWKKTYIAATSPQRVDAGATWSESTARAEKNKFFIEGHGLRRGVPIRPGSIVYLKAKRTNTFVDAGDPNSPGVVRARFNHKGLWQRFVVELAEEGSRAPPCVAPASLGLCIQCLHSGQCKSGSYCDPYMKKCVANSRMGCYYPIARCRPLCRDNMDPARCTCRDGRFPARWQHPTCEAGAPAPPPPPAEWRVPGSNVCPTGGCPASAPPPAYKPPTGGRVSPKEWEYFQLFNDLRAKGFTCSNGQSFAPNPRRMRFDCKLWRAAKLHSQDMAANGFFSHKSQDGRSPWDRARAQGTTVQRENIASGRPTAAGTLRMFERNVGHCKHMLQPRYQVFAMGYAEGGPYYHYWTQMYRESGDVDTSCYPPASMVQVARREPEPEQANATEGGEMASGEMAYGEVGDGETEEVETEDGSLVGEPWEA